MKILFINPTFFDGDAFKNRYADYVNWIRGGNLYVAPFEPPLGLAYLTAYVKRLGHDVTLLDMQALMMDSEELARRLKAEKPDVVGITAMTPTLPSALRAADIARAQVPASTIVLGGVHPTLDPETVIAHPSVDFVIRGEGEEAFSQLLHALQNGGEGLGQVQGLCFRTGGGVHISEKAQLGENLDSIPGADYGAFPVERYIEHNSLLRTVRGISMIVSRGCPYNCSFCAVQQTMGRKWRFKSPAKVVDEVIRLRDEHGIEGVWFKDSIFNLKPAWTKEFCRLMIKRKAGIEWQALTRINLLDEDELIMMKEAGLTQIDLGIESGSPKSLVRLNKKITVDQIKEKVALAKRHLRVFGFFMIGIPGEDEDDVRQTFDLAKSLELDRWSWSIYSPLPGSPLYDELIAEGRIKPFALEHTRVHFTEAYDGICAIPPARLKELYGEINEHFATRRLAAA
ncbi:radical SAM protein [Rhodomicrobium udaipurense JA643]|uniref:B12-binding domain-containing radical SAM protein n=1 Tax=Rhodomicrobium udaipurense TaxID=1202716 RepID=A0A8I1GD77_9HYPH|nr:radical SAM protein [Rhodomicrobium udaipurense]KAI95534.1 radical SAM protein [Rhodomicrobium udaipurense JA643]MBJ7542794.1 B12-binding domain-containing radical SAM protein [Rhodomicrobium udaipurense]